MDFGQKLAEAVRHEQFVRDCAFLDITQTVAGFECVKMTLAHCTALKLIKSPFLVGQPPSAFDAASFLWILSPQFSQNEKAKRKFLRRCQIAWQTQADLAQVLMEIYEFLSDTFIDAPPTKASGRGRSYYSDSASICDLFGEAYGWPIAVTMAAPLTQIFQLRKIITARNRAKAGQIPVMFNKSDEVIGEMLAEENRELFANEAKPEGN